MIKLTVEQIRYMAEYLDQELNVGEQHPTKTTAEVIADAVDAFNGGAR